MLPTTVLVLSSRATLTLSSFSIIYVTMHFKNTQEFKKIAYAFNVCFIKVFVIPIIFLDIHTLYKYSFFSIYDMGM